MSLVFEVMLFVFCESVDVDDVVLMFDVCDVFLSAFARVFDLDLEIISIKLLF